MFSFRSVGLVLGLLVWTGGAAYADKPADKTNGKANAEAKSAAVKQKAVKQNKLAESKVQAKKRAKARAQAAKKFLRLVRNEKKQPQSMQTSIVSYTPSDGTRGGVVVDLIGAVHIGEKQYYDQLNEAMARYDVLLYELVAPEGTKIPKGGRSGGSGHPIGALQQAMKNMLNLEFQLEQIDYTKGHFVHADMSPEQFSKSMKDRGESWLQMFFKMMGQAMAQQSGGQTSDADLLFALFSKDRDVQFKRIMAQQFEDLGGTLNALEGAAGSTIITERNKVALEVMAEQIKAGKKRIGIFYGAGHMADMQQRLIADYKMKQQGEPKWIEAWNLRSWASNGRGAKPVKKPAAEKVKKN